MVTKKATKTTKPKRVSKKKSERLSVSETRRSPLGLSASETEVESSSPEKYFSAVGRRKESVARVRLFTKKASDMADGEKALIVVNGKDYTQYFSDVNLQYVVESPLKKLKSLNRFKATALVKGGGSRGQADAVKHGIARALVLFDINFRKKLKKSGLLTRDPRVKERRKYGHKKARKSGQFSKR